MVDVLWKQLDPHSYESCFPLAEENKRRSPSPTKAPIPEEVQKLCEDAHRELEHVTDERYLNTLIEKRDSLATKVGNILHDKTANDKSAIASYVRTKMNGSYGHKSEDKILDMFEVLTSTKTTRRIYEKSRDLLFDIGGEVIRMVAHGKPDGFLNEGTDAFCILECKAKMGNENTNNRMIKDYLQAITYQMIYGGEDSPCETILLSHFELAKNKGSPRLLKVEHKVLSEWSLNHLIDQEWNGQNMDDFIWDRTALETVVMQSENQSGVLRVLHIHPHDALEVWNKMMERIRLLLMVVMTIIYNPEWRQNWLSTIDKALFLEIAMQALPQYYV